MNFIKKKIKKGHKKGSDKDYDFDDIEYPQNAADSNDTASKAPKDSEEWQFFEQLTQRVQDTVQKTQTTLTKLKDNSAIEEIHKLEDFVEPEEVPQPSPPPTSLSWVNFDEEGGVKLPPRPPPPKRPPPPAEHDGLKSPEAIQVAGPEATHSSELPPTPETGLNLLEEFGFQKETPPSSVLPTQGLLIVEDSNLEEEGPDPFDTSFVDLSKPVVPVVPEPFIPKEALSHQSLLDQEIFSFPEREETSHEQATDPFDTSYVETQLKLSTSTSQGFASEDIVTKVEAQPLSFTDSSFSEFKVSEDKLLSDIKFEEPSKEVAPKPSDELNFDSLGDVSEKSSSIQPSDLNFDPFDTSFTDTSATLNQKLSNLEKSSTGFLQKNYLLDDHEVQYETLNTLSIDDSTISADPFGDEKGKFDNRNFFGQHQEIDLQNDFQNLSFKPQSPVQEFEDLDNTFNEISELTDTIQETFEPASKEKGPSSSLTLTTSDNINEESTNVDSDPTFEACDLKGLTTSDKADSQKYLDFSLADTTITDNVVETSGPSETRTFEGFRVLDDALDSSAGTQEDFEEQVTGKSSSLDQSRPIDNSFGKEDQAFQLPKEAAHPDTDSSDFDPFGNKFEDNFSVPPQGESDPFGDNFCEKTNPRGDFDQQIDCFEDSFATEANSRVSTTEDSLFSPEQISVIEVARHFEDLKLDNVTFHASNKSTPIKSPEDFPILSRRRLSCIEFFSSERKPIRKEMSNPFLSDFEAQPSQVATSPFFEESKQQGTPKRRMSTNPFETDEEEDGSNFMAGSSNVFTTNGTTASNIFFTDGAADTTATAAAEQKSFFDSIIAGTEALTKNVTEDFFSMPPKDVSGEFPVQGQTNDSLEPISDPKIKDNGEDLSMAHSDIDSPPEDKSEKEPSNLFDLEDDEEDEGRPPSPPNQMSIKGIDNLGFQDRTVESGDFSELDDIFGTEGNAEKSEKSEVASDVVFSPDKKVPTKQDYSSSDPFDDIFGSSKTEDHTSAAAAKESLSKEKAKEDLFILGDTSPTVNPFDAFQNNKVNEPPPNTKELDPFEDFLGSNEPSQTPLKISEDKKTETNPRQDFDTLLSSPFGDLENMTSSKPTERESSKDPFDTTNITLDPVKDSVPITDTAAFEAFAAKFEKAIEKLESEPIVGGVTGGGGDLFDPFAMPGDSMKSSESLNEGFGDLDNFDPFAPKPAAPTTEKVSPKPTPTTRPRKLPTKDLSQDSFDDDDGPDFSVVIRPKMKTDLNVADSLGPPILLPPPPKTPTKGTAYSGGDIRLNPFQSESPDDNEESLFNERPYLGEAAVSKVEKEAVPEVGGEQTTGVPKSDSQESPSTPLFDEDTSQPLEEFPPRFTGDGWEMQLRMPNKKKITGNRFWKKCYIRLSNNILQLFNKADDNHPFQEMPLQPCYSLSELAAQQFDNYGKIFTVKLQYVFYRERMGVRPGQISKVMAGQITSMGQIAKLGLPLEHAPQVSQLLKLGTQVYADIKSFIQVVEDALFKLTFARDRALTYKTEEIQVTVFDEYYVEQNKTGHVDKQLARVRLFFLAFVSGMPDVEVGLNDLTRQGKEVVGRYDILPVVTEEWIRLEDVEFHSCVKKEEFEKSRTIKLVPPDACLFELLRFRIRPPKRRELPLQLKASMVVVNTRIEIRADILVPGYSSRKHGQIPCEDIQIRFPIPECWIYLFRVEKHFRYGSFKSASRKPGKIKGLERIIGTAQSLEPSMIEVSTGQAKYEHHFRSVVWRIPRLPKEGQGAYTEHLFILRLELTSFDQMPESFEKYVFVEFTMPGSTVSHTTVRSISVTNPTPPEKFVRYVARHAYRVEMEFPSGPEVNQYIQAASGGDTAVTTTVKQPVAVSEEEEDDDSD